MSLDLLSLRLQSDDARRDPSASWAARSAAIAELSGPVATIDLDALRFNAMDLVVRSGGVPIRVASKSIRVREVLDATLAIAGFRGILAFTLPEALWLARDHDDVVLGYPTVDRAALAALVHDEEAAARITLMVDDLAQLDVVDAVASPASRATLRVAIDADAAPAAKLDLDDAALAATSAGRPRWRRRLNGGRHGSGRNDLHRDQLRGSSIDPFAQILAPSEELTDVNARRSRDFRNRYARLERRRDQALFLIT